MNPSPTLRVTDDEVAALSIKVDAPWQGPLPTIDVGSPQAILVAGLRGLRSLAVRGLLAENDNPGPELAPIVAALDGRPVARAYLSSAPPLLADGAMITSFFAVGSGTVVIDVTEAPGVHLVGSEPEAVARQIMCGLMSDSLANSTNPSTSGYSLCILIPDSGGGSHLVTVGDGRTERHMVAEDGSLSATEPVDIDVTVASLLSGDSMRVEP